MPQQSHARSSNYDNERSGRMSWRKTSLHGSTLILSVVKEAATFAPFAELKRAASVALLILQTIHVWARKNHVNENKEAYERLGDDSGGLIVAIWRSYKKAEIPQDWLSAEMREILEDLTNTLEDIVSFVQEQLSRNKAIRVIFSRADAGKISEYRETLNYAMQKFELQSHMNINDVLMQLMRKNDQLSAQILHRNEEEDIKRAQEISAREARDRAEAEFIREQELETVKEISALEHSRQFEIHQAEDESWRPDELDKIEKEAKDRKVELKRLRAAASAVELAQHLKEEEIADLRLKFAAEEDGRQSTTIRGKKSYRRRDEVEEEWRGKVTVEEASSEEEEEVRRPVRSSSKVKRNPSKSPNRRSVASKYSADDYEEDSRSLKSLTARRKPSRTSLRKEETEDEYSDQEEDYVSTSPRNNPQVNRKGSSHSRIGDVDDLISRFQAFTPPGIGNTYGSGSNPRSSSPMYFPAYGASFSPPTMPYEYGIGLPGMILNSGVGNITNTNISNVGNDNSVKTIHHVSRPHSQRRTPEN